MLAHELRQKFEIERTRRHVRPFVNQASRPPSVRDPLSREIVSRDFLAAVLLNKRRQPRRNCRRIKRRRLAGDHVRDKFISMPVTYDARIGIAPPAARIDEGGVGNAGARRKLARAVRSRLR